MNWLNQLLCSHKFYFRVRDEKTNKNKWECQTCGKRFPYLDNTDLPVPRLTAPKLEPNIESLMGNLYTSRKPRNLQVVYGRFAKKNLTPTEPTIYDTVMDMVERGL
jgi:hypothetical protein